MDWNNVKGGTQKLRNKQKNVQKLTKHNSNSIIKGIKIVECTSLGINKYDKVISAILLYLYSK